MSLGRILGFLGVFGGIMFALHAYVYARLVRSTGLGPAWRPSSVLVLTVLGVTLLAAMIGQRYFPRGLEGVLAWVGFTWLGLLFFLFVTLLATEVLRLGALGVRLGAHLPRDPERRYVFARLLAGAASLGALGMGVVALKNGVGQVPIKPVRIPLAKLPAHRAGYRIVQLSDIHIGPMLGSDFLEDLVARTNALAPDAIVITGDLVDGTVETLAEHVAPLAKLHAPDGVYFVTGNHEYYSGVDAWLAHLPTLGVRVLRNERVRLAGGDIDLAGIDDWTARAHGHGHGADLPRALAGRDPSKPLILLAHQPKAIVEAAQLGVDLQLSGHTHGGQLFPFGYLVPLAQPYVAGLHEHEGARIYVSQGTGYWGPPMRLAAPSEITNIELAVG